MLSIAFFFGLGLLLAALSGVIGTMVAITRFSVGAKLIIFAIGAISLTSSILILFQPYYAGKMLTGLQTEIEDKQNETLSQFNQAMDGMANAIPSIDYNSDGSMTVSTVDSRTKKP